MTENVLNTSLSIIGWKEEKKEGREGEEGEKRGREGRGRRKKGRIDLA